MGLTVDDLKVMRPSDALAKAVEMYPNVGCAWTRGYLNVPNPYRRLIARLEGQPIPLVGDGCPAALLAAATTRPRLGIYWAESLQFDAPEPLRIAAESRGFCNFMKQGSYAWAIANLTLGCSRDGGGWPKAISMLRDRGL